MSRACDSGRLRASTRGSTSSPGASGWVCMPAGAPGRGSGSRSPRARRLASAVRGCGALGDGVAELADVAGPGVALEAEDQIVGDGAGVGAELLPEGVRQQGD